jgi:hypothetical protein
MTNRAVHLTLRTSATLMAAKFGDGPRPKIEERALKIKLLAISIVLTLFAAPVSFAASVERAGMLNQRIDTGG